MKRRVYPTGSHLKDMHSFFVDERGTWFRRLGSYSIQVLEPATARPLWQRHDLCVDDHAGRYLLGRPA
jgi:radical SAM superfamily enzyme with C-terminal helix-hairpin-helix motif